MADDDGAAFAKLLAKFLAKLLAKLLAKPFEHPVMSRVANCCPLGAWYCWEAQEIYRPIST